MDGETATVELYCLGAEPLYKAPASYTIQFRSNDGWQDVSGQEHYPLQPMANGRNRVEFPSVDAPGVRIVLQHPPSPSQFRLIELEVFDPGVP